MLGLNREKASLLPHDKEWKIAFENEKNILREPLKIDSQS